MKHLSLLVLGAILLTLFTGCQTEEKKPLSGFEFNNQRGIISVTETSDFVNNLTIDMYIKLKSYPENWTSIVSKFVSDHDNEFNIRIKDKNTAQWYYGVGEKAYVLGWNPSEVLPLNQWVRLTAIRNRKAKTMTLMINNKVVATKKYANLPQAKQNKRSIVLMARDRFSLNGEIADLKIWKSVLSDEDLKNSFEIENPENQSKLVGYWKFDNIENGKIIDLSGNKRNGKIVKIK